MDDGSLPSKSVAAKAHVLRTIWPASKIVMLSSIFGLDTPIACEAPETFQSSLDPCPRPDLWGGVRCGRVRGGLGFRTHTAHKRPP